MEKIEIGAVNLDEAVNILLEAKKRGESVYCDFNGHELYSDSVTVDSAYMEVLGKTKEEFDKRAEEGRKRFLEEEKACQIREQGYAKMLAFSRNQGQNEITPQLVIEGLKFIAENQSLPHEELVAGLLELGCNFTMEEVDQKTPKQLMDVPLFRRIAQGDLWAGASIIANTRDSEFGRSYVNDQFLSIDDSCSVYGLIRTATGDDTYTKENVDTSNNKKSR